LWENIWNDEYVKSYRMFDRWATDTLPLAGEYFRAITKDLMWDNLTASWSSSSLRCCAGATARTSRQGFDEFADQVGAHGCDRVRDVAFRPRGRSLWVDNRRVSEVSGPAGRNEVLRGE
jgi:hypothetical protein